MGWIIFATSFMEEPPEEKERRRREIIENYFRKIYEKDHIKKSIKNVIREAKEGKIKCRLAKRISAIMDVEGEIIEIRCKGNSDFGIPIVWIQELDEACNSSNKVINETKEWLKTDDPSHLVNTIFSWLDGLKCKTEELWKIIKMLGLDEIVTYDDVKSLIYPNLLALR